jgi:hypothetical protein
VNVETPLIKQENSISRSENKITQNAGSEQLLPQIIFTKWAQIKGRELGVITLKFFLVHLNVADGERSRENDGGVLETAAKNSSSILP